MKKILFSLLIISVLFTSCDKDELIFQKVRLEQNGEYVVLSGFLPDPLTYEFSYSVRARFCDKWVDLLVVIPPGETEAHTGYVFDESVKCHFSTYELQWQTHLVQ